MEVKTCKIEGCGAIARYPEICLCEKHYKRLQRHGDPNITLYAPDQGCKIEGCTKKHRTRGYCATHYNKILALTK